jgi:type IV pilus assembly protein PilC
MAKYSYSAVAPESTKTKTGVVDANSKEQAIKMIKANGMVPINVNAQTALNKEISFNLGQAVKPKDLAVFCRQFLSVISAGVSVLVALDLLAEQNENKYLKKAIQDVHSSVEKGESLADSMSKMPKIFPSLLINMIEAGEMSGNLEIALDRMAIHFEKEAKLKRTIKKATTYPMIVSIISVVVVAILVTFVVPTFVGMFAQMGTELPGTTKALLAMSDFMKTKWWLLLIIIGLITTILIYYSKTESGKMLVGKIKLKAPIFGKLNVKVVASRFSRTMSTLLASGVSLLDALEIVSRIVGNHVVEAGLLETREQVSKGVSLNKPLRDMEVFPPMVTHMIKIGEESGAIESMLNKVADFYDDEVETAVEQMTTMLEPAIIGVLALVVGFVIISIIQPMFGMYDAINNY